MFQSQRWAYASNDVQLDEEGQDQMRMERASLLSQDINLYHTAPSAFDDAVNQAELSRIFSTTMQSRTPLSTKERLAVSLAGYRLPLFIVNDLSSKPDSCEGCHAPNFELD